MRYQEIDYLDEVLVDQFADYEDIFENLTDYGSKIVPLVRKIAPKTQFLDIKLFWNEQFAVTTAETVTNMVLGYSFNILPSHEMFNVLRFAVSSDRTVRQAIDYFYNF